MTKEEKIKEAYREWYHLVEDFVDEHGWLNKDCFNHSNLTYEDISATIDFVHDNSTDEMIPKEIRGIRDNKGWVKIESEDDLPKTKGNVKLWFFTKQGNLTQNHWNSESCAKGYLKIYSHYQFVIEPKPPIY